MFSFGVLLVAAGLPSGDNIAIRVLLFVYVRRCINRL